MKPNLTTNIIAAAVLTVLASSASAAGPIVFEKQVEAKQVSAQRAEAPVRFVEVTTPVLSIRPMPWTVKNGASLQDTLTEWSAVSGWVMNWDLPPDEEFILGAGHDFEGDFSIAVKDLFAAMPQKVRLTVDLLSSNRPPLLYVSRDEGSRQ